MGQVIIDFRGEPEFPVTDSGVQAKIEKLRDQLAQFADAYAAAKGVLPERIVLAPGDYKHIAERVAARLNQQLRKGWELDYLKRKASDRKAKRGPKPEPVTISGLRWGTTEIVAGLRYSKHRPVDPK